MNESQQSDDLTTPGQLKAWLNVAAKLSGAGLSFLLMILLTRSMTSAAFGSLSVILAWLAIAVAIASFSMPLVTTLQVAAYLAKKRYAEARGVFLYALAISIVFAGIVIIIGLLAVTLDWIVLPGFIGSSLSWLALLLPISVALVVVSGLLQGLKRIIAAELWINASRPLLIMGAIALLWYLDKTPLETPLVIAVYTLASGLVLLCVLGISYSSMPQPMRQSKPLFESRLWFRSASGFMTVNLATAVNERIDIIIMSYLTNPDEIAVYAVASRFSQTVIAAVIAVIAIMTPYLAERLDRLRAGDKLEINRLIQQTATTVLWVAMLALAGFATLGPLILMLFGEHYAGAYAPMLILASGLVVAALFGPALSVAVFIGKPAITLVALIAGMLVNAGLSYQITPVFGAPGAAIASATGMVVSVALGYLWLLRRSGLNASPMARLYQRIVPDSGP